MVLLVQDMFKVVTCDMMVNEIRLVDCMTLNLNVISCVSTRPTLFMAHQIFFFLVFCHSERVELGHGSKDARREFFMGDDSNPLSYFLQRSQHNARNRCQVNHYNV